MNKADDERETCESELEHSVTLADGFWLSRTNPTGSNSIPFPTKPHDVDISTVLWHSLLHLSQTLFVHT